MSVVTKNGDAGTTRFFSGESIAKSHPRLETYGTVDELVSGLGLARSLCQTASVQTRIHAIQKILFVLGAELATPDPARAPFAVTLIAGTDVATLDAMVADMESRNKLPPSFIVPGGCTGSAALDVARTICRRVERLMVRLTETGEYHNPSAIQFVNRLSDVCFLLARDEEAALGIQYDRVK